MIVQKYVAFAAISLQLFAIAPHAFGQVDKWGTTNRSTMPSSNPAMLPQITLTPIPQITLPPTPVSTVAPSSISPLPLNPMNNVSPLDEISELANDSDGDSALVDNFIGEFDLQTAVDDINELAPGTNIGCAAVETSSEDDESSSLPSMPLQSTEQQTFYACTWICLEIKENGNRIITTSFAHPVNCHYGLPGYEPITEDDLTDEQKEDLSPDDLKKLLEYIYKVTPVY